MAHLMPKRIIVRDGDLGAYELVYEPFRKALRVKVF